MNLLSAVEICTDDFLPLWNVVGTIVKVVWIGIPIILIVLGSIDLGKAVISSKEEEVKKAKKSFINRLIYAILVFAVVWIVGIVIGFVSRIGLDEADTNSWRCCWNMSLGKTCEE